MIKVKRFKKTLDFYFTARKFTSAQKFFTANFTLTDDADLAATDNVKGN